MGNIYRLSRYDLHTALALRQAIWRKGNVRWQVCGIPGILYTDHGSDFTSRHLEQVCIDLKINLKFSIVGRPQGRGKVERFFNSVNQLLLMQLPGYNPPGSSGVKPVLTLEAFTPLFENFVVEQYHHRVHSVTKQAPLERWTNNGFLPRLPNSLEQLDLLLLSIARSRKVHRDGIRFKTLRYISPTLAPYVGEDITIRYDPRDISEIRVFHQDQFLCRALCQELAGETVSLKEIIQARRKRKKELRQIIAERKTLLESLLYVPNATAQKPKEKPPKETKPIPKTSLKIYKND